MLKQIEEEIRYDKESLYISNRSKEVEAYMPGYCQFGEDCSRNEITIWVPYDRWMIEEQSLLELASKKWHKAYSDSTFIRIPINIPDMVVSKEEIKGKLEENLISLRERLNELEKKIEETENVYITL